jgi:hypothetical protein
VKGRSATRGLRIELLRARAAADRLDLALALRDIGEAVQPLRRGGRIAGTVVRTLAAVLGPRGARRAKGIAPLAALLGLGWLWRRLRRSRSGPR